MFQDKPAKIFIRRGAREVELSSLDFTKILFSLEDALEKYPSDPKDKLHEEYKELFEKLKSLQ